MCSVSESLIPPNPSRRDCCNGSRQFCIALQKFQSVPLRTVLYDIKGNVPIEEPEDSDDVDLPDACTNEGQLEVSRGQPDHHHHAARPGRLKQTFGSRKWTERIFFFEEIHLEF